MGLKSNTANFRREILSVGDWLTSKSGYRVLAVSRRRRAGQPAYKGRTDMEICMLRPPEFLMQSGRHACPNPRAETPVIVITGASSGIGRSAPQAE